MTWLIFKEPYFSFCFAIALHILVESLCILLYLIWQSNFRSLFDLVNSLHVSLHSLYCSRDSFDPSCLCLIYDFFLTKASKSLTILGSLLLPALPFTLFIRIWNNLRKIFIVKLQACPRTYSNIGRNLGPVAHMNLGWLLNLACPPQEIRKQKQFHWKQCFFFNFEDNSSSETKWNLTKL